MELDMIANLMSKDPLLYANKKMLGGGVGGADVEQQRAQQNMLNQMAIGINVGGNNVGPSGGGHQLGRNETNGQLQVHEQNSPQIVMNGARMSSTSSGEDSPPSASPNSTASINSILSHQQQQHHAGLMSGLQTHQSGQQHHGNIVTNGSGLLPGLDSPVDITGLLNQQLKAGSLSGLYSQHDNANAASAAGGHASAFHNRLLNMQSPNTSALTGHSQQLKNEFGSSSSSGGAGPIRRHRSSAHDSMQKCQFCPKKYSSVAALRNHMEDCRQIRVHECAQCGKRFKARGGLQQHNRIHLQERPYHCHFCPKRFTQKSHVDQHERIHTGAKPFVCQFCGRAFRQRSQQMGHEATHTHGNSMAVSQVSQAGSLNLHQQLGNLQTSGGQHPPQPHGSGLNGQSDRGSLSDQSCQNSPVVEHPNQLLQNAAHAAAIAASSSQMHQQPFMDKNGFNAAMLNAMLSNSGGGTQLAADSLLALKQGQDHLQQTLELISGR